MIFKIWEELTETEVNSIKRKLCTKCAHFSGMGEKNNMLYRFCNYSENTGKCRLCDPRKCKELGYFKAKERRNVAKNSRNKDER